MIRILSVLVFDGYSVAMQQGFLENGYLRSMEDEKSTIEHTKLANFGQKPSIWVSQPTKFGWTYGATALFVIVKNLLQLFYRRFILSSGGRTR